MIMCVIMTLGAMPMTASAAAQTSQDMHAEVLNELHLMAGTDKGMQLHKKVNRVEAITMLIKMMGEEGEALSGNYSHPFTDVPAWADPFVGYAYEHELTAGVPGGKFGSNNDCTQAQYLTFILRSLGHSDKMGEFTWDKPYALAKTAGLIQTEVPLRRFSRGDMADISFYALTSDIVAVKEIILTESAVTIPMPEAKPDPEAKPMPDSVTDLPIELPELVTEEAITTKPGFEAIQLKKLKDQLVEKNIFTVEEYEASMADYGVGPKQKKTVYLTFDDGPSNKVTPRILNTLRDNGVPATFFVLGSQVDRNPDIVRRAYQEGHKIANHGYSHNYSHMYKNTTNLMNDLNSGNAAIDRALGFAYGNKVFRFPGGSHQKSAALKNAVTGAGHKYYDWTSSGQDSISASGSSAKFILDSTINTIWGDRNNVIVLLHDTNAKGTTADALPGIIKYFRDHGYEFKTL